MTGNNVAVDSDKVKLVKAILIFLDIVICIFIITIFVIGFIDNDPVFLDLEWTLLFWVHTIVSSWSMFYIYR